MNKLTYTRCGDYYIPDLELSEQPEAPIGKLRFRGGRLIWSRHWQDY